MNTPATNTCRTAGIFPWLPWPLSAWSWWTEPVRAERLALLRIGMGVCLLIDVAYHYAPETLAYFGKGGLGDPAIFDWRFQPPRANWSLLRGVGDAATQYLSLAFLLATTLWMLGNSIARFLLIRENPPFNDRSGVALALWLFSYVWYVAGLWSQMLSAGKVGALAWGAPLAGYAVLCLLFVVDAAIRLREPRHRIRRVGTIVAVFIATNASVGGAALAQLTDVNAVDKSTWWLRVLGSWQQDNALTILAMALWLLFAAMLAVGFMTRFAAIAAWLMSMSFANANPYLDNAGDTIRLILLFYLMFCPCGAAWSVDALLAKRGSPAPSGPVYVHPWALRLIFVQMIFIYFMNGLYKLFGVNWLAGDSLHYVLGDVVLARFSQVAMPIPFEITRIMTWSVLAWEVSFPLLVLFRWPRRIALVFGVLFHLGIFATMELGGFVPYALCMYLPLCWWGEEKGSVRVLPRYSA